MVNGESSVGSNVVDQTYRIQSWDFIKCQIPDLTNRKCNCFSVLGSVWLVNQNKYFYNAYCLLLSLISSWLAINSHEWCEEMCFCGCLLSICVYKLCFHACSYIFLYSVTLCQTEFLSIVLKFSVNIRPVCMMFRLLMYPTT